MKMAAETSTKHKKLRSNKRMSGDKAAPSKGEQAKTRIISVAEALFNKQGFDGASMRDIATAAKMQPASVYYYFESKEELLWAVWEKGGLELVNRVIDAIADKTDPWQRMETACVAHTTGLLDWRRANQALFIMPPWHYPDGIKARVIALRDEYEKSSEAPATKREASARPGRVPVTIRRDHGCSATRRVSGLRTVSEKDIDRG